MNKTGRLTAVAFSVVVALGLLTGACGDSPAGSRLLSATDQALRDLNARVTALEATHELRLRTTQADTLVPGRSFERLDQYYQGVPVFGGEAVRETDGVTTRSITASLYDGISVAIDPRLSPDAAATIFISATGARAGTMVNPGLVVLPRADGGYVLAYRMAAVVRGSLPVLFVNATTGAVERRYNNLQTQQAAAAALIGNGVLVGENLVASDQKKVSCAVQGTTYTARDLLRPMSIRTYDLKGDYSLADSIVNGTAAFTTSDLAANTGSTWKDSVVVDGHTYIGWTYDYFYKRDGWMGFDGNNARTVSIIVHPVYRADLDKYAWADVSDYYANAFFCGQCGYMSEDLIMFGEGLPSGYSLGGRYYDYLVASLGIVAHEYTHGVTTYTSNLIYQDESGALDEAFSDMMGQSVNFFQRTTTGSGLLQADYIMGKESIRPSRAGSAYGMRDLGNPAAFGDPDHYSRRYTGTDDNGGVHTNSTIASYAFYLAIEGGTDHTSGLSVTGVGAANRAQIERVFFRGFTTLPANATFSMARVKTIQSARDLYGAASAVEAAITQAWTAVGVF